MESAFGIDHGDFSKADKKQPKASGGRIATGTLLPGYHAAFAGKKGHKLRAIGNEVIPSMGANLATAALTRNPLASASAGYAGAAYGTTRAQAKGHYKRQRK